MWQVPICQPGRGRIGELNVESLAELPAAGDFIQFWEYDPGPVHRGRGVSHLCKKYSDRGTLLSVEVWLKP